VARREQGDRAEPHDISEWLRAVGWSGASRDSDRLRPLRIVGAFVPDPPNPVRAECHPSPRVSRADPHRSPKSGLDLSLQNSRKTHRDRKTGDRSLGLRWQRLRFPQPPCPHEREPHADHRRVRRHDAPPQPISASNYLAGAGGPVLLLGHGGESGRRCTATTASTGTSGAGRAASRSGWSPARCRMRRSWPPCGRPCPRRSSGTVPVRDAGRGRTRTQPPRRTRCSGV
jgi:hypothetical protein